MIEISNLQLTLDSIPNDDAPNSVLQDFALTFNGYDAFPEDSANEGCADIANKRDHSSLSKVRACLFFEQRRSRQSDFGWDDAYVLELLALIRRFVRGARYRLPGVKGKKGASAADLVSEISALCEANLKTIKRVAYYNLEREMRDEINRRLRNAHNVLGMAAGSRRFGCLYREKNLDENQSFVAEHAVPVTALVRLFETGERSFIELVFFPVVLISQQSDQRLNAVKLSKSGHDVELTYLLKRYATAGIEIETYDGVTVDASSWTSDDHLELIKRTPELADVYAATIG